MCAADIRRDARVTSRSALKNSVEVMPRFPSGAAPLTSHVTESLAIVSSGHPPYKGPQPRFPPYATTGPGLLISQGKSCDDLTRMPERRFPPLSIIRVG